MPLYSQQFCEGNLQLALWQITENKEQLLSKLSTLYHEEAFQKRSEQANALHYLASRCAILELFPASQIILHKNGLNQPSLLINNKPIYISITHSADMAGVIISEQHFPGIDLEKIDTRITRVKHKFMNQTELDFAGAENQIDLQTLIWSAKETLYKVYAKKEIDFKEHLHIQPFHLNIENKGNFTGFIRKEEFQKKFNIHYQIISNIVLTY
ncbi:MAG: 4'-phosphopantetheinyl transferase superfamily protein, partial [Bacteroidia bacterium]|nr:4'-phosphopantetheinyl transferase superfamily protein [Bacteroidia bacterium]